MKKIKNWFSLSEFSEKFLLLLQRMPASVAILIGFAVVWFRWIHSDILYHAYTDPFQRCVSFCVVGLFISVTAVLWLEDRVKNNWIRLLITLLCVALWGAYCLTLPAKDEQWELADALPVIACGAAFLVAIFFISFLKRGEDGAFWQFSQHITFQIIIAAIFCLILFAGLSLAIGSIQFLFNVNWGGDKVFGYTAVLCFVLFAPLYALSNIPDEFTKHRAAPAFNRILKILGLYILMPLLAIYAVILYAYLIKIIVQWKLPDGYVSWLVSALSLGGMAVITILYPMQSGKENDKIMRVLRNFGLLVLPLLILMSIGILRRIHDYGISIFRCYVLLLNVWFYGIFIYLYLSRARKIKGIFISATVIFLLASVGPWRFSSVVKRVMTKKLETIFKGRQLTLTAANAWFDHISKGDKITVKRNLAYLNDTYGRQNIAPYFKEKLSDDSYDLSYTVFPKIGLDTLDVSDRDRIRDSVAVVVAAAPVKYKELSAFNCNTQIYNIQGYQSCISFHWTNSSGADTGSIRCEIENDNLVIQNIAERRKFSFYLKPSVTQLTDDANSPIVLKADNCMLLLQDVRTYYYGTAKDSVDYNSVSGILFYK